MSLKIISGGQSGADQAGWRAARRLGLPTGGWMPRGFLTEDGPRPEFAREHGAVASTAMVSPSTTRVTVAGQDRSATRATAGGAIGPGVGAEAGARNRRIRAQAVAGRIMAGLRAGWGDGGSCDRVEPRRHGGHSLERGCPMPYNPGPAQDRSSDPQGIGHEAAETSILHSLDDGRGGARRVGGVLLA